MVNKQYNIQNSKKSQNYSPPPPMRNSSSTATVISSAPNPHIHSATNNNNNLNSNFDSSKNRSNNNNSNKSIFRRNLNYFHNENNEPQLNQNGMCAGNNSADENNSTSSSDSLNNQKDLSINDIGRFQYILQMDREMGTNVADQYFRPSSSTSSIHQQNLSISSNSINSTNHHTQFWKAGSQSPITSSTSCNQRRRERLFRYLKIFWIYSKWPLALLIACGVLATLVYYLVVENELSENITNNQLLLTNNLNNAINLNTLDTKYTVLNDNGPRITNQFDKTNESQTFEDGNSISGRLAIFIKNPEYVAEDEISFELEDDPNRNEYKLVEAIEKVVQQTEDLAGRTTTTANSPILRNTQILEISTPKYKLNNSKDDEELRAKASETKLMFPTKETLEFFGFTSGHQNNFGVPIEEDERILRMLNEQLLRHEQNKNYTDNYSSTTDTYTYRTKVSPTLPILPKFDVTTERLKLTTSEEGICQSTSLPMCRSVMHYDLTTIKRRTDLSQLEIQHFEYLINSKCSMRAHEFICSVLEPECRPKRMGILQPCKRICKSILEPCAHIIAASEFLTMSFDCDSYPDSNDPNVCRDASRNEPCLDNEFQCDDKTCIPSQWRCDNIKDCSSAEDEHNCTFCEEDEFKCFGTDKCIPEKYRCDQYEDCPDASDEMDCYEDDSRTFPPTYGNTRVYPFTQEQNPNYATNRPYLTISGEDRINIADELDNRNNPPFIITTESESEDAPTTFEDAAAEHFEHFHPENKTQIKREDQTDDIQGSTSEIVPISKSLANFQDSKEIMMTSDSETDFKYSKSQTDEHKNTAHNSPCPQGELRCVNGQCITLSQLCDKITDCPDGADEAMCIYKN